MAFAPSRWGRKRRREAPKREAFIDRHPRYRPEGMAIEMLQATAARSGLSFSWVIIPADTDIGDALRNGRGDIMADWGETESRSREFVFSKPYVTLPVNVFVRKGSSVLRDARQLAGLRVGVVRRSMPDDDLSRRTGIRLGRYDTVHEVLFHLLSGEVDAVVYLGPALLEEARAAGVEEKIAMDAMPEGGRLVVSTGTRTIGEAGGSGAWSPSPGRYATVSVADTGCGMDREALSHIFEPFHTTKGFGRGMGLPSVYGFVKQCSGYIEVASAPGRGTTVTIGLPLVEETATA